MVPQSIIKSFGFNDSCVIQSYGSGHIHRTYKVEDGKKNYILQRINHYVFKQPDLISKNIRFASEYLSNHYPDYLFLSALKSTDGFDSVVDSEGYSWRLFPFIQNTKTVNEVSSVEQAFEAANGFAALSAKLSGCDPAMFSPTIDRFLDLNLRFEQFEAALRNATQDRMLQAENEISLCRHYAFLNRQYEELVSSGKLKLRITHNDTKINNILFSKQTGKVVCVIDLDTLMPGYFIYDLGDMVRTFVSPVSEEETDLSKVVFRKEIYSALVGGYLSEMNEVLSSDEKEAIPFAGLMMTYITALRFLADFLSGDVYFSTSYDGQNLNRAKNQLKLLEILFQEIGIKK